MNLTFTQRQILKALEAPEPQTVRDFAAVGLTRCSTLKYALMDLENEGLIVSRLPMATSPLRLYELAE
jgi:DNA-binding MarR family transcriptional regulator